MLARPPAMDTKTTAAAPLLSPSFNHYARRSLSPCFSLSPLSPVVRVLELELNCWPLRPRPAGKCESCQLFSCLVCSFSIQPYYHSFASSHPNSTSHLHNTAQRSTLLYYLTTQIDLLARVSEALLLVCRS